MILVGSISTSGSLSTGSQSVVHGATLNVAFLFQSFLGMGFRLRFRISAQSYFSTSCHCLSWLSLQRALWYHFVTFDVSLLYRDFVHW